jgi:hypothetical protein
VSGPALPSYRDPLDLLRRFLPTPFRTRVRLPFATVELETNDLSLFPTLVSAEPPVEIVRTEQVSTGAPASISTHSCLWKIVRDVDVGGKVAEASIVMAGSLMVYTMGPACLIGADRDRKEILGFIGRDVDLSVLREFILPAVVRLTEYVTNLQEPSLILEALEVSGEAACHA